MFDHNQKTLQFQELSGHVEKSFCDAGAGWDVARPDEAVRKSIVR